MKRQPPLTVPDSRAVATVFLEALPHYAREVLLALAPIAGLFLVFQPSPGLQAQGPGPDRGGFDLYAGGPGAISHRRQRGLPAGGPPAGAGSWVLSLQLVLIPLGALLGWFIVEAEPAVHVLCVQVESVTGGAVSKNAMGRALSIGMAVSVALAMARILFGIPLYAVILPGYVLAMGLSFAVPPCSPASPLTPAAWPAAP